MTTLPTPLVSVDWLSRHLHDPNVIILDATLKKPGGIAPPVEAGLSILGARFFDIKNTFSDSDSEFPNTLPNPDAFEQAAQDLGIHKDSKIVVYDAWGIYSSPRAWWMFHTMGHEHVSVLDGGLPAWKAANQPLQSTYSVNNQPGNFQADFQAHRITYIADIEENLKSPKALVLDARSSSRFEASVPEPRAGLRGGHIPGSKSLPFARLLTDGKMKSVPELKAIFQELNPDNQPIITSCGSGVTASVIFLAGHIAGQQEIAVYDGSWTEYAQNLQLPVEK